MFSVQTELKTTAVHHVPIIYVKMIMILFSIKWLYFNDYSMFIKINQDQESICNSNENNNACNKTCLFSVASLH